MKSKNWFEVSKEGLKELQAGKPKHFVARELIQNAWDENTTYCDVDIKYNEGKIELTVKDDSPEGFRDLADAFTLFKHTYKRGEPGKRGRFNVGEKQALAICDWAMIKTTKGTITFGIEGREKHSAKTDIGSEVKVKFRGTKEELQEIIDEVNSYLVPEGIIFKVNGVQVEYRASVKLIVASLETEIEENGIMRRTQRKTNVRILKPVGKARLYELGIPVCEIDCQFDIDVQQKVPLSIDRETVPERYLSNLYAEVLNATHNLVREEDSSRLWIRDAVANKRISKEAVEDIIHKRFGDKVCAANPFDPNSIDEAVSRGYNVVYGAEMSAEEWGNIKRDGLISSSTELFGASFTDAVPVKPDEKQERIAELAKKIAMRTLGLDLRVSFIKSKASCSAEYGNGVLTFNVSRLPKFFWDIGNLAEVLGLIIHEIAHSKGNHTEMSYHECLTDIAGKLIVIALEEPEFFER